MDALSPPSSLSLPLSVIMTLYSSHYLEVCYTYYLLYKVILLLHETVSSIGARTVFLFSVVPRTVTDTQNVKERSKEEREEEKKRRKLGK